VERDEHYSTENNSEVILCQISKGVSYASGQLFTVLKDKLILISF
jgi:hypothetical protein